MADDLLDDTLLLKIGEGRTGEGAVDLESINEDSDRDQTEVGHILHQAVVGGLVKNDSVLGLVLDCEVQTGEGSVYLVDGSQTGRDDILCGATGSVGGSWEGQMTGCIGGDVGHTAENVIPSNKNRSMRARLNAMPD